MDGQEPSEQNAATPLSEQSSPESQTYTTPETMEASTKQPQRISSASAKHTEQSLEQNQRPTSSDKQNEQSQASENQDALSSASENTKVSTSGSEKQNKPSLTSETPNEQPSASVKQIEPTRAFEIQNKQPPASGKQNKPSPLSGKQNEASSPSGKQKEPFSPSGKHNEPSSPYGKQKEPSSLSGKQNEPSPPSGKQNEPASPSGKHNKPSPVAAELKEPSPTCKQEAASPVSASTPTAPTAPTPKRVSSSRRRMERELLRMQEADENARLRYKDKKQKEVRKAVAAMYAQKKKEGVTLTPDVESSRAAIRTIMTEEERMALAKDQKILRKETKDIRDSLDKKYGVKEKKRGPNLRALAEDFYHNKVHDRLDVPEHVRRQLTKEEIQDLKMVFDMFDVRGRGYITANDVKRAASMLGFKAKKEVFKGMIGEATGDTKGRVSFVHFLQFVVRGQGAGDDPLDAILQCFRLLDRDQKGYITVDDLREVADSQKVPLSNRAIREMIQEADVSGDARVTSDEFIHIMLQTGMFHATR